MNYENEFRDTQGWGADPYPRSPQTFCDNTGKKRRNRGNAGSHFAGGSSKLLPKKFYKRLTRMKTKRNPITDIKKLQLPNGETND